GHRAACPAVGGGGRPWPPGCRPPCRPRAPGAGRPLAGRERQAGAAFCPWPCSPAARPAGASPRRAGSGGPALAGGPAHAGAVAAPSAGGPAPPPPSGRVPWAGVHRPRPDHAGRRPPTGSSAATTGPTPAPPGPGYDRQRVPPTRRRRGGARPGRCRPQARTRAVGSGQGTGSWLASFLSPPRRIDLTQAVVQRGGARRGRFLVADLQGGLDHPLGTDRLGQDDSRLLARSRRHDQVDLLPLLPLGEEDPLALG